MRTAPLAGVRVIDLTHILAGPFCTQMLADGGADVIKVEPPAGEYARIRGQRRVGADGTEVSSYMASINRNKRSIALDLKSAEGRDLLLRLIATADVVVENFAPGTLERLNIRFADLRAADPRLVTCSISLFGGFDTAPSLAHRGGLAIVAESESGIIARNRSGDSLPHALPLPLGDMGTGLAAYASICTKLFARERTGEGGHLDIAMVKTLLALNSIELVSQQLPPDPAYSGIPAGMGLFETADGHVAIGVNNDLLFSRLMTALERPELAQDPRYRLYADRDLRAGEINRIVEEWTKRRTSDEIVEIVARHGVPCGKVATPRDVLDSPSLRGLGYFCDVDDGIGGSIAVPANPLGFDRPHPYVPRLGEHADEVLSEVLDLSPDEIAAARRAGALGRA